MLGAMNFKPPAGDVTALPSTGLIDMLDNDVTLLAVSVILGLISILFLRSYDRPLTGERYMGIS